jgi:hypothetical protein
MLIAVTACRFPEHPKRAALSAATTFVLRSVFDLQSRVPLTQNSARPARQATVCQKSQTPKPAPDHRLLLVATYADGHLVVTRCRTL